jgi:putative hydrolase
MNFIGDFHVHTVASGDAFCTIDEISKRARHLGLKVLAITDHGPAMPASSHRYYFNSLVDNVKKSNGIKILSGVEANIIDEDGTLDLPKDTIARLSFVIISFHGFSWIGNDIESNTGGLINCINNYDNVKTIAHLNNPYYEIDIEKITPLIAEKKIAIELNNKALKGSKKGWKSFKDKICYMDRHGVKFVVSSDAHNLDQVGVFDEALDFIDYCKLDEQNILNTSMEKLKDYLELDL